MRNKGSESYLKRAREEDITRENSSSSDSDHEDFDDDYDQPIPRLQLDDEEEQLEIEEEHKAKRVKRSDDISEEQVSASTSRPRREIHHPKPIYVPEDYRQESIKRVSRTRGTPVVVKGGGNGKGAKILGRAGTWLGNRQGDHTTPHALPERAIRKYLSFDGDEEEIRSSRTCLCDLLNSISIFFDSNNKVSSKILKNTYELIFQYESEREKMLNQAKFLGHVLSYATVPEEEIHKAIEILDDMVSDRKERILKPMMEGIAENILEYYNKIPYLTFYADRESSAKAPLDEGAKISKALNFFDDLERESKESSSKSSSSISSSSSKKLVKAIQNTIQLLHYPKVDDSVAATPEEIKIWRRKNHLSKDSFPRDNSHETLSLVVARHIYFLEYVYPNLNEFKKSFEDGFIKKFLQEEWEIEGKEFEEVSKMCKTKLENFETEREKHNSSENSVVVSRTPSRPKRNLMSSVTDEHELRSVSDMLHEMPTPSISAVKTPLKVTPKTNRRVSFDPSTRS